jgi:ATP-dependent helicase/nuclease subunit B
VLEDCVLAVAQMVRAGSFRPALSEVSFGHVKDSRETLGEFTLALPDGRVLSLDGKIDRLDFADVAEEKVALVFDYKRSEYGARFDWSEFYHGLDLQLPIYMLAVRSAGGAERRAVAGAFYMPIEVSPGSATLSELPQKADAFGYKARGLFNGNFYRQLDRAAESGWSRFYGFYVSANDAQYGNYAISGALRPSDFEVLLQFSEQKIIQLAQQIVAGAITVRPYRLRQKSPCSYCCYKAVCRFDWQINDYNLMESLNKLQVLSRMGARDG